MKNMKKNLVLIFPAGIILIASAAIWYINRENKNPSPPPLLAPAAHATYICSGQTIDATFYKGQPKPAEPGEPPVPSGSVKIVLSDGRNLFLPQTISADGSRYANSDESFVLWSKGDYALVRENNVEKKYVRTP
jgi:membrane-bound inhibitor of C-type lysozyme